MKRPARPGVSLATAGEADDDVLQVRQTEDELHQHHLRTAAAKTGGDPEHFFGQQAAGAFDQLLNTKFIDDALTRIVRIEGEHALRQRFMIARREDL